MILLNRSVWTRTLKKWLKHPQAALMLLASLLCVASDVAHSAPVSFAALFFIGLSLASLSLCFADTVARERG